MYRPYIHKIIACCLFLKLSCKVDTYFCEKRALLSQLKAPREPLVMLWLQDVRKFMRTSIEEVSGPSGELVLRHTRFTIVQAFVRS